MLLLKYCLKRDMDDNVAAKYIYTFIICSINISFGMGVSSFGPSFVDLKYIMNTTMERISFFSFFLSIGYTFGSLFGFLYKYLNRQIVMTILIVINAFAMTATPNARFLTCFYFCAFLCGMCGGAWSNAKTVWLIEIWQAKSAPVLHSGSFLFGVGTIIGPLIDKYYVTGEVELDVQALAINGTWHANATNDQDEVIYQLTHRRERLMIPFLIIGSVQLIGAIMMGVMYLIRKYVKQDHTISETQSKDSKVLVPKKLFDITESNDSDVEEPEDKSRNCKRILLIAFVSTFLAFQMSSEVIYMQFSATYLQYIPLKLSAKMSATIMSSMGLTFTIGRGVTAIVSLKLRPQKIICIHLFIVFFALFLLYSGQHSLPIVWTGALIMAYGLSPIICSAYCFLTQYLEVKNRIGTILLFSAESLNMFVPLILGTFIEQYPQIFLCVLFINILFSSLTFTLILYIVKRTERKSRLLLEIDPCELIIMGKGAKRPSIYGKPSQTIGALK